MRKRHEVAPSLFEGTSTGETDRLTPEGEFDGVPTFVLDIPETIPQLGYGSHQFFRYYGKFPSILGREVIRRWTASGTRVLDCYAGSGTTLVEAQIAGLPSFGIDINPLAVLACEVKTRYYDPAALRDAFELTIRRAEAMATGWFPTQTSESKLKKWFTAAAVTDLGRLRAAVETIDPGNDRDFLTVALLGVVRRCSNAFDGEVRPHINRAKKPRPPLVAFRSKFEDMLAGLTELDKMRAPQTPSRSVIGDNRDPSAYAVLGSDPVGLVVAHPPYLNSFNYLSVFSLEFMWAAGLDNVWRGWTPAEIRAAEHRAHPATDEALKERYYSDFAQVTKAASAVLADGGVLAVVIGDATIRKELEPVHAKMWGQLKDSGLTPEEIWFRTTHYGIGKYAYSHRADYHGNAEKRDAVMFFRR
jgi:DNA modification methylase